MNVVFYLLGREWTESYSLKLRDVEGLIGSDLCYRKTFANYTSLSHTFFPSPPEIYKLIQLLSTIYKANS